MVLVNEEHVEVTIVMIVLSRVFTANLISTIVSDIMHITHPYSFFFMSSHFYVQPFCGFALIEGEVVARRGHACMQGG
jgi:hypothetical protein